MPIVKEKMIFYDICQMKKIADLYEVDHVSFESFCVQNDESEKFDIADAQKRLDEIQRKSIDELLDDEDLLNFNSYPLEGEMSLLSIEEEKEIVTQPLCEEETRPVKVNFIHSQSLPQFYAQFFHNFRLIYEK